MSTSITDIKCSFWKKNILMGDATNWGRKDYSFDVIVAGSNAYNKGQGKGKGGEVRLNPDKPNGASGIAKAWEPSKTNSLFGLWIVLGVALTYL